MSFFQNTIFYELIVDNFAGGGGGKQMTDKKEDLQNARNG